MSKLINSEQKYNHQNFKVKIGTINKKNPEVVYINLGTYIKPNEIKNSFSDYIIEFDKKTRFFVKKLIVDKNTCYKDFILVTDIADERINKNKKSYLDLQIFLKPKNNETKLFKAIAGNIYDEYATNIITYVKNELYNNNIECYKTKK